MRHGLFLPIFDELAEPRVLAELAATAEASGWDGVFVWDHVQYRAPTEAAADPWIALAAMAMTTERVLLGPLVTPLARRRPHIIARQTTSLDRLSKGRLVLGVGLGLDTSGRELSAFGEELDARTRAAMLDESLDVVDTLWSGKQVDHLGTHYRADGVRFLPRPVQRPRIPVWVAARYPNRRPLRRAARWDGVVPIDLSGPDELTEMLEIIGTERGNLADFDVVVTDAPGGDPATWAAAGATWYLTGFDPTGATVSLVHAVTTTGPPAPSAHSRVDDTHEM